MTSLSGPNQTRHLSMRVVWMSSIRMPLALAALLLSSCTSPREVVLDKEHQRIKAQADAWDTAIVRKDAANVEANLSDDFLHIGNNGNLATREQFLAAILSPDLVIDPYEVDEFRIRMFGDTALVHGATEMTGTYKGQAFRSHYRFTDTYVRKAGEWRLVNVQTTKIND